MNNILDQYLLSHLILLRRELKTGKVATLANFKTDGKVSSPKYITLYESNPRSWKKKKIIIINGQLKIMFQENFKLWKATTVFEEREEGQLKRKYRRLRETTEQICYKKEKENFHVFCPQDKEAENWKGGGEGNSDKFLKRFFSHLCP